MGSTTHTMEESLIAEICDIGVQLVPQDERYTFSSTDQLKLSDVQKSLLVAGYRLAEGTTRDFQVFNMVFRLPDHPEAAPVILRFIADGDQTPVVLCYHWHGELVQVKASACSSTWSLDGDATDVLYRELELIEVQLGVSMLSYSWIPVLKRSPLNYTC